MGPQLIPLIIFGLQEALKYAPTLAAEISTILTKSDATAQDWIDLQAKYSRQSYESIVTESGLKPTV